MSRLIYTYTESTSGSGSESEMELKRSKLNQDEEEKGSDPGTIGTEYDKEKNCEHHSDYDLWFLVKHIVECMAC